MRDPGRRRASPSPPPAPLLLPPRGLLLPPPLWAGPCMFLYLIENQGIHMVMTGTPPPCIMIDKCPAADTEIQLSLEPLKISNLHVFVLKSICKLICK